MRAPWPAADVWLTRAQHEGPPSSVYALPFLLPSLPCPLQAARFLDPKYPVVRLQPTIPVLHFYLRQAPGM